MNGIYAGSGSSKEDVADSRMKEFEESFYPIYFESTSYPLSKDYLFSKTFNANKSCLEYRSTGVNNAWLVYKLARGI